MTEENQEKSEEVEKVLMQSFALNAFSAFNVLQNCHWCPGEAVDMSRRHLEIGKVGRSEVGQLDQVFLHLQTANRGVKSIEGDCADRD